MPNSINRKIIRLYKDNKGLLLFILLMTVFRSALADWNVVPTGSMKPTIIEGDRILVNKMAYDLRLPFTNISLLKIADPERGDIVVFDSEVSDIRLVKRVVGMPGDHIAMRNNVLSINGLELDYRELASAAQSASYKDLLEDLLGVNHAVRVNSKHSYSSSFEAIKIPNDYYLMLGDNRDNSADSRVIGLVPRDEIVGRTRSVVMSLNYENNYLPRQNRFLHTL